MSLREMQHQVTVDGGASATDGYSPAGEAPPPATRLLDLLPALLDVIACRVMQLGARSLLPLTCRAFSQARLLHVPALRIQLGRQCCDQLLTPRVVAALQARTMKLALTLWQPETEDGVYYSKQLAPTLQLPQTEDTQDYTDLLGHALAKLDNCAAVEVCSLVSRGTYNPDKRRYLRCPPGLAQHLLDSFPSLTALTLRRLCVTSDALASLLSHPPLALQLQQLDITHIISQEGDEPRAVGTLFQGLQLKQLSIDVVLSKEPGTSPLPSFQPLAQHLSQLHLVIGYDFEIGLSFFMEYLQPLAQLQLAAAGAGMGKEWTTFAYLTLHSLSQPLVLWLLDITVEVISDPEVAAALHHLAQECKVPVKIMKLELTMRYLEHCWDSTPASLQQQRVDLAQLVALLQPLQCCDEVLVRHLHGVTAADVLALAPLCRDCTYLNLEEGSVEPSLEFWHQLVQLMPAVQEVTFYNVKGSFSAAMHESLQLMAEQPWARWLDITISYDFEASQPPAISYSGDELPACWQAGSWVKAVVFKVNMFSS